MDQESYEKWIFKQKITRKLQSIEICNSQPNMSNMNITRTNINIFFICLYYNNFTVHDLYRKHCLVCVMEGGRGGSRVRWLQSTQITRKLVASSRPLAYRSIRHTFPSSILSRNASMYCRPIDGTHGLSKYLDAIELVSVSFKGLSHEMDLAFDDMHDLFYWPILGTRPVFKYCLVHQCYYNAQKFISRHAPWANTTVSGSYLSSLYSLTNTVPRVRGCLSIWLERLRWNQKEDEHCCETIALAFRRSITTRLDHPQQRDTYSYPCRLVELDIYYSIKTCLLNDSTCGQVQKAMM